MAKKTSPASPEEKREARKTKKPDQEETISRADRLLLFQEKMNKRFKGPIIMTARESTTTSHIRRPTGITRLDRWIAGGIQAGSVAQFIGKSSSCKTYVMNRVIAHCQRIYGNDAAIFAGQTELHYDKGVAKKTGVRVALSDDEIAQIEAAYERPLTEEEREIALDQVGEFHECKGDTAEETLEVTANAIATNDYQLVILDSIGALNPQHEVDAQEGLEQASKPGGTAKLVSMFTRRVQSALNQRDAKGRPNCTTLIVINQWRDKVQMGKQFGSGGGGVGGPSSLSQSGGHGLMHGLGLNILFEQGTKIYRGKEDKDFTVLGKEINWEIIKAKTGCHDGPKGSFNFYFGDHGVPYGADVNLDLYAAMVDVGLVVTSGTWKTILDDEGNVVSKAQSAEDLIKILADDIDVYNMYKELVFKRSGVHFVVREPWYEPTDV